MISRECCFELAVKFTLTSGLCKPGDRQLFYVVYCCCCCIYSSVSVFGFLIPAARNRMDVFNCTFSCACLLCYFCYFALNRRKGEICGLLKQAFNIYRYDEPYLQQLHRERLRPDQLKWNFVVVCLTIYISLFSLLTILAFVPLLVDNVRYDDFHLSYLWKPYEEYRNYPEFLVTYFIFTFVTMSAGFGLLSGICLYYYLNDVSHRETTSLIELLKSIDSLIADETVRPKRPGRQVGQDHYCNPERIASDDVYLELLLMFFRHHQALNRYAANSIIAFRLFANIFLCVCFLVIVSFISIAVVAGWTFKAFIWYYAIIFYNLFLFLISYSGEYYTQVNKRFRDTLYEIEWYRRSVSVRKLVLMIITVTNFDLRMSATPKIYFGYILFIGLQRKAYAFINFLLNFK